MKVLGPLTSLEFFEENLPDFLSEEDDEIKALISPLKTVLENTESPYHHSESLEHGKDLLKYILKKSISYLSEASGTPQHKSIEVIEKYIDAYTPFEELMFGLDPDYRDHTLHSLWVYLFGHQWIENMGGYESIKIAGQVHITYFIKKDHPRFILLTDPLAKDRPHLEAMWGMIALLHDLGYPVEIISNESNEIFANILNPFAIDFASILQVDVGSRISILHQSICDLLSKVYGPQGISADEREKFYKEADEAEEKGKELPLYKHRPYKLGTDEAHEMEFKIASVNKNHAAWSTIFAFKNIAYLHESDFTAAGLLSPYKLMTRRDILYSIVHHTCEEPKDTAVNRLQFILLLIDDIEECARFGRGGRPRGVSTERCDLKWDFRKYGLDLELDYSNYPDYKAKDKYYELSRKYKYQTLHEGRYEIRIRFLDEEDYSQDLKLVLAKDA